MAELTTRKLVVIAICLMVLIVVLLAVSSSFRNAVFGWIKEMPEYKYEYDEEASIPIEQVIAGACDKDKVVGGVGPLEGTSFFKENYIYLLKEVKDEKETKKEAYKTILYWRGNEKDAKIFILRQTFGFDWLKSDLEIAKVENGKIKVYDKFFELDNELYQRLRFNKPKPIKADELVKLHNSYYSINNILCKGEGEAPKIRLAWPDNKGIINLELNKFITSEEKEGWVIKGGIPYFEIDVREANYFYFQIKKDYIQIIGKRKWHLPNIPGRKGIDELRNYVDFFTSASDLEFARIYPDNSFWVSNIVRYYGMEFSKNIKFLPRPFSYNYIDRTYYETNIKVKYDEVLEKIKK